MKLTPRVLLPFLCVAGAMAGPITFTGSFYANGSVNGNTFSDLLVTLTVVGDTTEVTGLGGVYRLIANNAGDSAKVTVAGTTYNFIDTIEVVSNQGSTDAGFSDTTVGRAVAFVLNAAFSSYDLTTSIGPYSGGPGSGYGAYAISGGGDLGIESFQEGSLGTFQATGPDGSVPEPRMAIPGCRCLLGLCSVARRLRHTWEGSR